MNQVVRVVLLPKDAGAEAAGDRQIVLDMNLDTDTGVSTGPFPAFGRVGDFKKPETLYPFALMRDNRMDYGAYATEEQRQDVLDIRDAKLAVGQEIAYRFGDKSHVFVISSVTPIVS